MPGIIDLPSPIVVVCHDAGAANHIIQWLSLSTLDCRLVMQGPAERIWKSRFPHRSLFPSLAVGFRGARSVLTGTGWATDLEYEAISLGRSLGLPTASVIDHWVNYQSRFERNGVRVLPNEIWVTDEWAFDLAKCFFPEVHVRKKPNYFLEHVVKKIKQYDREAAPKNSLFVLEPVRDDWGRGQPGEFQALDYFFERRSFLGISDFEPILLRPHPSDPPGKYDHWVRSDGSVIVSCDSTLEEAISSSRQVIGIQSYALVVACAAGRKVVSALPPWAPALHLPRSGIIELRLLCGEKK